MNLVKSSYLIDFYGKALDNSSELVCITNATGDILFMNAACQKACAASTMISNAFVGYFDARERSELSALYTDEKTLMGNVRLRIRLPDGTGARKVEWHWIRLPTTQRPCVLFWSQGIRAGQCAGNEMGFTIQLDGTIQTVSPELCTLCGYSKEELIGRKAREFYFSPDSRTRILSELLAQTEVENGQVTVICKDGSPRTLRYSAESIRDASGEVCAYSGWFQQCTPELSPKMIQEFSRVVHALPNMAWICGLDHCIVAANEKYCASYGRSPAEILGKTEFAFLPAEQARVLTEAALQVFEDKQEVVHPAVRHTGDQDVWLKVIRRPLFDDDRREVVGMLGIAQDITSKIHKEDVFIQGLVDFETDTVAVFDIQGRLLRRGTQRLSSTMYDPSTYYEDYSVQRGSIFERLHPEDLEKTQAALRLVLHHQREECLECRILPINSQTYSRIFVRLLADDTIFGEQRVYVIARNVTEHAGLREVRFVLERLKKVCSAKTDRELAGFLNVSAASISNARKNGRVPADWLIGIGQRTGVSIDWLITGSPTRLSQNG